MTASLGVVLVASAANVTRADVPIADGLYQLHNARNGAQNPPPYGLRLDGLDGVLGNVFTFDFDHSAGGQTAEMFLDLDLSAGTIRIFGSAFGGLNDPSDTDMYDDPGNGKVGWWDIDFTYSMGVEALTSDTRKKQDIIVENSPTGMFNPGNTGTISRQFSSSSLDMTYDLTDKNGPGYTFRFGDSPSFNGVGWLIHSGVLGDDGRPVHVQASDWLFTAEKIDSNVIPIPGAYVLGMVGMGFVGLLKKRFG